VYIGDITKRNRFSIAPFEMHKSTLIHISKKIKKMLFKSDDESEEFKNLKELRNYYFSQ
jgi:hypothetical protein